MKFHLLAHPVTRLGLVAAAVGAVVLAPLGTSGGAGAASATSTTRDAAGATIVGASSLTQPVAARFTPAQAGDAEVHLLAYNDFHGNLEPASMTMYGQFAGGAAYLAKLVKDRQALYGRNQITMFAGDNVGAAPLANALFHEEPAVIVANLLHVDVASVGNHEFDKGAQELLRLQKGGCSPTDGCNGAPYALANGRTTKTFPGADFEYLSSNVVTAKGKTLLGDTFTKRMRFGRHTVKFGVIGEVLESTPEIVTPAGVAGLTFQDEITAANKAAVKLKRQGVASPILVIHQGGAQTTGAALNGCAGNLAGSAIETIAAGLDPSIKVIVSGHTHAEYRCLLTINGVTRLITSAGSYGRVLSDLTLGVDPTTGEIHTADATNIVVANAVNTPGTGVVRQADTTKADPTVQAVVDQYVAASAPLANKVIGSIQGDLVRTSTGESTVGDVIADAQLDATSSTTTGASQVAFMNPGGIRSDFLVSAVSGGGEAPGQVTYGEAFTVQPFGNSLVVKTMTGAQIRTLLEQQYAGCSGQSVTRILQVSRTFSYDVSASATDCTARIGEIRLNGAVLAPTDSVRVTMNSFLATGGDGFTTFSAGTDALGGATDIEALVAEFAAAGTTGIAVPPLTRIITTA